MRYKCVSPCPLRKCSQSRVDDIDLKLAFMKLPDDELSRRIASLPHNLRRRALRIKNSAWIC